MQIRPSRVLVLVAPSLGVLAACKPDSGLTKFNSSPEASITAPSDGATVLAGTTLELRGAASDPNHATTELLARWFVDDAEACATTAPADDGTTTCTVTVPDATELSVRLEVLDPEGSAASDTIALLVTPNADPVATIQAPMADGVYYSDQLVTFRGTVSDAEDDAEALTVEWESSRDGVLAGAFDTPDASGGLLGATTLSEGAHFLTLTVTDSVGNTSRADVTLDVGPPNSAPACAITAPEDGSAGERGASVTFRGSVSDVDIPADLLSVTWTSDKDGPLGVSTPTSGGSVTFPYADLSVDTHVVSMQVVDEVGATCTAEVLYTVGSPPEIDIENPLSGDVVNEGDTVTFTALVSDGEDVPGDLWVAWESDVDGLLYEGPPDSSGLAEVLDDTLTRGDHVVTATVTDSSGLYATARTTLTVNGLPSAPGITLSPASPDTDDDLRVSIGTASVDPDGDPVTYSYAWSLDGVVSGASTSATLPASATTRGDVWSVAVTATDGLGTSAAGTASVAVANTAPVLASLTLSPDPATEDDVLVCTAGSTSDADGDAVGIVYDWTVDGVPLGFDSDTLDGAYFDRGDAVVCTATPTDGADDGVTRTSNTVVIENSAPSVATVSIAPDSATASSTLTCSYTGYDDADGDADQSIYTWTVDGAEVGTGRTLSGAFVGGDVVTCTVTPFDGTDAGTGVSANVTISNTAPVLASVSLTPDPAYEADTLRCTPGSVTDSDGTTSFTYSYGWIVNGSSVAATGSTLTGAYFSEGDEVACVVTASDGSVSSAAVTSNAVSIANTAPVMASVTVSPSSGRVGDTLTCTASATDADGSVSYGYRWSNGAVGASYTLTASDNPGDVVTCTATATDTAGATATGTASATVSNTSPVLASVSVTPSTGRVGDTLVCSASATDADGGAPSVSYAWSTGAVGASTTLTSANDPGDVITCTATASDADGGSATGSASATVANTNPMLGTVSIAPASAYNDDLLSCSVMASDADGGTPTLAYAWTNTTRGTTLGSGATLSLSSATAASRDAIACAVTATDTSGGSASGSASVTLSNRAPVVIASLSPSSPTARSTLTCSGSATDADADTTSLSFAWTVDGAPVTATSTSATLSTLAGVFAAGQLVACTVSATDGKTGTDTDSATVEIDNTAPVVSSVTLSPSTVYTNDTLTATASGSDADGDTLSYTYDWYVGGSLVQSSASKTLSGATHFDRDEVVYVTATADDGVDIASATSGSITVSNSAPTAPMVEITPSDAESGDDLTCEVVTESTDADGDTVTYAFAWDVDGVEYTDATDSEMSSFVDGGDVGGGETWTCEVVAGDGGASSAITSDSIFISTRPCTHVLSLYQDGTLVHSYEFDTPGSPSALFPFFAVNSTGSYVSAGATIDNVRITDNSGAVLLSDSFSSGAGWTLYGGGMGGTSITSGVAVANSDWSDFISVSAVDLTNGINYAADVRWSSSTDRVYMGFLDARGTGRGLRSILCRGVGTAFACPSGALSTLSAYNSDTSTLVTNNITLPSGVPNVGTTTTYTLTTEPNGDCW